MTFIDNTLTMNIDIINVIEHELKIFGFKKYKSTEKTYIFKNNPKYPLISIKKDFDTNYSNSISFYIEDYTVDWEGVPIIIIKFNDDNSIVESITDNRSSVYPKYFMNEVRKHRIKKLLESDNEQGNNTNEMQD